MALFEKLVKSLNRIQRIIYSSREGVFVRHQSGEAVGKEAGR